MTTTVCSRTRRRRSRRKRAYDEMTLLELRAEAKRRGLPVWGNKADIMKRLSVDDDGSGDEEEEEEEEEFRPPPAMTFAAPRPLSDFDQRRAQTLSLPLSSNQPADRPNFSVVVPLDG